jgi:hypothetical protein
VFGDRVKVTGWGEPGLYYGTLTLLQLLRDGRLPVCKVTDWPDYACRMVHYDLAREQTCDMRYLKSVVDRLSRFKVNMMDLYFETRFRFEKHPLIGPPGVMTSRQAGELDAYARARFIELVPQLNVLGHLEQALSVKEYRHLAEVPDDPEMIAPLNPDTPQFLEDLITEMSAAFTSKYFHIGGDEAWQMGKSPEGAAWIKRHSGMPALFAMHYRRVHKMVSALGRKTMMWGDMLLQHPETADLLPKDITIFDWHYDDTTPETIEFFTGRGFPVFVCPAMNGFGRTAAPFAHAQKNIWTFIGQGKDAGAVGECTCAWELRLGHLFDNDYFGIILSADRSWNVDGCKLDDFNRRFCQVFYGIDDLRPVEYFQAVSDGFAAIQAVVKGFPARSSWRALTNIAPTDPPPDDVLSQVHADCVAHRAKCLALLDSIRRDATRNRETLDFADLPAHTSMLLVERLYAARRAALGDKSVATALLADLDYFRSRFEAAVKAFGGSTVDVERVEALRAEVTKLVAPVN